MGLDISAYRRIKHIATMDADAWEERWVAGERDTFHLWPGYVAAPIFSDQIAGSDLIPDGVYEYTEKKEFRAGSYSGYNSWRNTLSIIMLGVPADEVWANPADFADKPFFLLINFSDSEGLIGDIAAQRLAAEFAQYQGDADGVDDEYWRHLYGEWRKAFEMAADGGLVRFH